MPLPLPGGSSEVPSASPGAITAGRARRTGEVWNANRAPRRRGRCASRSVTLVVLRQRLTQHWTVSASGATTRPRFTLPRARAFRMSEGLDCLPGRLRRRAASARVARAGPLRQWSWCGRADASAEKRAEAAGFAKRQEAEDVQAVTKSSTPSVEIAQRGASRSALRARGPTTVGRRPRPFASRNISVRESRRDSRFLPGAMIRTGRPGLKSTGSARRYRQPSPACSGAGLDASARPSGPLRVRPQLGIETWWVIPCSPGAYRR